ncbi:MAG: transketolase C-terminal domain-containing protein [Gudongella sp.]|jgi:pyruvate ferredoxin oxidoreductase alpha subunit|nr:transketolase C-terminal domain-containing protein [Gudongella sp.]
MNEKQFVSGNEAVALAVKLVKPHVIAAYPITPQTIVVERLSDFVEDGSLNCEYMYVESEHSAISAVMGASSVGARTFTATSSQGLLYMAEGLHYASGARFPIVMMNANRSVAVPWNIFGDQRDSLSQLDSGWIQFYVEDAQEALDTIIQAYRIAEDPEVMTPVMVNLDGFVLTHTYELIEVPKQETVNSYIPYKDFENKMDLDNPKSTCITAGPPWNAEFKYKQHLAIMNSLEKIEEADKEYGQLFGRSYGGMIENYHCDDAEVILVTLGSIAGTTRLVVDKLRSEGKKVGMLKLRCIRPFPKKELVNILKMTKAVGVLEKSIGFGFEGTLYSDVNSALTALDSMPVTHNFVAGLGGRSISKEDIEDMYRKLLDYEKLSKDGEKVEFVKLRCEIDGN